MENFKFGFAYEVTDAIESFDGKVVLVPDEKWIFWWSVFEPWDNSTTMFFVLAPREDPNSEGWIKRGSFDFPPTDKVARLLFQGFHVADMASSDLAKIKQPGEPYPAIHLPPRPPAFFK